MDKQSIKGKRHARKMALQALYQWNMTKQELSYIEAQYRMTNAFNKIDVPYFQRLLKEIPANLNEIEANFLPYLDRAKEDLTPIELAVLRISTFELTFCPELPYKVILDEAVMLAKEFGSQDGYRYVNGVLNKVAHQLRTVEIGLNN